MMPELEMVRERLVWGSEDVSDSPFVKGTTTTVSRVISLILNGWTWGDILRANPELTEDDIRACLAYEVHDNARDPIELRKASDVSEDVAKPCLPIVRVEYRRLKAFGRYDHETIGVVVEVPEWADPDAMLKEAREWVDSRLNIHDEVQEAQYELRRVRREKEQIEAEIEACKARRERARAFLLKHDVNLPEDWEVPF